MEVVAVVVVVVVKAAMPVVAEDTPAEDMPAEDVAEAPDAPPAPSERLKTSCPAGIRHRCQAKHIATQCRRMRLKSTVTVLTAV